MRSKYRLEVDYPVEARIVQEVAKARLQRHEIAIFGEHVEDFDDSVCVRDTGTFDFYDLTTVLIRPNERCVAEALEPLRQNFDAGDFCDGSKGDFLAKFCPPQVSVLLVLRCD